MKINNFAENMKENKEKFLPEEKRVIASEIGGTDDLIERFNKLLAGKFSEVPNGNFKTRMEGVDSLTITRQGEKGLSVVLFYDNHKKHTTFSLFEDGILSGRVPKELKINNDQILDEILRIIDSVEISSWHHVSDEILPPGFWPETEDDGKKQKEKLAGQVYERIDPERIQFMTGQKDYLFGFDGENSGFRGYFGYVFPWGIVLENSRVGNAAYFLDFNTTLGDMAEKVKTPERGIRVSKNEKEKINHNREIILEQYWRPVASKSKYEARNIGLKYFIHRGKDWQGAMAKEINDRRVSQKTGAEK
ncbi:MAG: hypothetical protein UV01_C0017G0015 [Parcubacteria group bacterium GW2011_GWA2_42_14]|nr:MAG: hypothetical protein UV01_C0017G0015 [Parcubacteria group bacterium GW2011_GWA2_42_14]